jgi:hypothetical protein
MRETPVGQPVRASSVWGAVVLLFWILAGCSAPEPIAADRAYLFGAADLSDTNASEDSPRPDGPSNLTPAQDDQEALSQVRLLRAEANKIALLMPPAELASALKRRVGLVTTARERLTLLKSSSDPSMVVLGYGLESAMLWELAGAMRDSDTPEAFDHHQIAMFRQAIEEKADALEATAKASCGNCAEYASACARAEACALNAEAKAAAARCAKAP